MNTNTEKRRSGFEAWFESIPWPMCEKCSKDKDIAWQAWSAALDSVCSASCECEAIKSLYLQNLREHSGPK